VARTSPAGGTWSSVVSGGRYHDSVHFTTYQM
jgi:hypothetical protein